MPQQIGRCAALSLYYYDGIICHGELSHLFSEQRVATALS